MYKKFVLLALAVPFFLTGCWDKKDPEDRAFIITLGVDAAEISLSTCTVIRRRPINRKTLLTRFVQNLYVFSGE